MGRTVSDAVNDLFVQRPPARRPDPAVAEARSCLSGQTTVTRTDAIVGSRNVEQDQPDAARVWLDRWLGWSVGWAHDGAGERTGRAR